MVIVNKVESPKKIMKKIHDYFNVRVVEVQKRDTEVRGINSLEEFSKSLL